MTTMVASVASPKRTTNSTKPWSITVGRASRRVVRATNCVKRGNTAGTRAIVGGTKTATAGTRNAIGMTTITIATNSCECGFSGVARLRCAHFRSIGNCLQSERELVRSHQLLIGKNSFEAAGFIVIVQHHNGHNAQVLLAGMTLRHFALQV